MVDSELGVMTGVRVSSRKVTKEASFHFGIDVHARVKISDTMSIFAQEKRGLGSRARLPRQPTRNSHDHATWEQEMARIISGTSQPASGGDGRVSHSALDHLTTSVGNPFVMVPVEIMKAWAV